MKGARGRLLAPPPASEHERAPKAIVRGSRCARGRGPATVPAVSLGVHSSGISPISNSFIGSTVVVSIKSCMVYSTPSCTPAGRR